MILVFDNKSDRIKTSISEECMESLQKNGLVKIERTLEKNDIILLINLISDFQIIAIHESFLKELGWIDEIKAYVLQEKKYLILFSGNNSTDEILEKGRILKLDANTFYSNKLVVFARKYSSEENVEKPLLKFLYGEAWRLSLLLRFRFLLWYYGCYDNILDNAKNEEPNEAEEAYGIFKEKTILEINKQIENEKERMCCL